jgi:hypothetical protein
MGAVLPVELNSEISPELLSLPERLIKQALGLK